jgi:hypothetical protein
LSQRKKRKETHRQAAKRFPFTVLRGLPYSDLPLRKELVVRREVRELFFKVLEGVPRRHLEGLKEIIAGQFQHKSMFTPDGLYDPSCKTIIIASSVKNTFPLTHEIGHHVYDNVLLGKQRQEWRKIVKDQFPGTKGSYHFREFFADSYARHYTHQRDGLFPLTKTGRKRLDASFSELLS